MRPEERRQSAAVARLSHRRQSRRDLLPKLRDTRVRRQVLKLRRFLGRLDDWLEPVLELWAGCIILILSASFWISPARPVWDLQAWPATVGALLGPLLVYRAWTRK